MDPDINLKILEYLILKIIFLNKVYIRVKHKKNDKNIIIKNGNLVADNFIRSLKENKENKDKSTAKKYPNAYKNPQAGKNEKKTSALVIFSGTSSINGAIAA